MKKTGILFLVLVLVCTLVLPAAYAEDVLTLNLKEASDEELAQAVSAIKAEQRARLKTKIVLEPAEIIVKKGGTEKISASVAELPEGVTAGDFVWTSQSSDTAAFDKGAVRGVNAGTTILTCTSVLSDGTEVSADCAVTVIIPIKSLAVKANKMDVMTSDTFLPELVIKPEDASITDVTYESADPNVVKVTEDGRLYAVAMGKTNVTVYATDGSGKTAKFSVTVGKKIGKYDGELTYQNLSWGADEQECVAALTELDILDRETNYQSYNTSSAYLWPENDLLFNSNKWDDLPVVFADVKLGASRLGMKMQKSIAGFEPQTAYLYFLNSIGADGEIDPERNELAGVYFRFDNSHEKGRNIFRTLLTKLEEQYGEFTRYMHKNFSRRSYKGIYDAISGVMQGANIFTFRSLDKSIYLYIHATCVLRGQNNTGIMLSIDQNEQVTLYYGKTDVWNQVRTLEKKLNTMKVTKDDAGL